jgi:hypothetical protein
VDMCLIGVEKNLFGNSFIQSIQSFLITRPVFVITV